MFVEGTKFATRKEAEDYARHKVGDGWELQGVFFNTILISWRNCVVEVVVWSK